MNILSINIMNYFKNKKGVYLINNITSDKNLHKIGCSSSLCERIKSGYINPNILLIGLCDNYKEFEKIMLKEFISNFGKPSLKKEFFNCLENDAIMVFKNTIKIYNYVKLINFSNNIPIINDIPISKTSIISVPITTSSNISMNYSCDRCGYSSEKRCNFINHLNRKIICKPNLSDISIEKMKENLKIIKKEIHKYICKCCKKEFDNRFSKYQHQKKCKITKDETSNDKINNLEKEIEFLKNNIINYNNFGQEDISHISYEDMTKYCTGLNTGMVNFIKNIHFNKNIQENMNVRMKNKNILEVIEYRKWIERDCNNTIDDMIEKCRRILFRHFLDNMDNKEILQESSDIIRNYFVDLEKCSSQQYYKLRREIYFVIKNNNV